MRTKIFQPFGLTPFRKTVRDVSDSLESTNFLLDDAFARNPIRKNKKKKSLLFEDMEVIIWVGLCSDNLGQINLGQAKNEIILILSHFEFQIMT